jgi:hypothetical protein
MKRKTNLSEEIYKMRKLINFDPKEYNENVTSYDRLIEEKMIEKYLLKEQKPVTNIETTPKDQGQFGGGIGGGSTEKNKDKEASQEDISKLTEAAFAEDIKEVANKSPKSLKISDELAKKISEGIVSKAQVKGSNMNKVFRTGLLNGTLNIKKTSNFGNIKVEALNKSVTPMEFVNGRSIKGEDDKTETPEIPLYASNESILMKSTNPEDIASWVLNQNVESFLKGEQQYYLITFGNVGGVKQPTQSGFFMAVKGDVPADGILTVGVSSNKPEEGTIIPGKTIEEKTPVDLVVELSEAFATGFSTFKNNLDINSINVISSASNYYKGVVDFTHDRSGNVVKKGINYNQKPIETNKGNVDANNLLSWNRGQRILSLIKSINGSSLGDVLGNITILNDVTEKVEWRVTDTGGNVDPAGAEGSGQYARLYIKGVAEKIKTRDVKPKIIPGSNEGNLRQVIIYVDSSKSEGGKRIASWFDLTQSKYDKSGKNISRNTGTFTGLPKWLDNIIYK